MLDASSDPLSLLPFNQAVNEVAASALRIPGADSTLCEYVSHKSKSSLLPPFGLGSAAFPVLVPTLGDETKHDYLPVGDDQEFMGLGLGGVSKLDEQVFGLQLSPRLPLPEPLSILQRPPEPPQEQAPPADPVPSLHVEPIGPVSVEVPDDAQPVLQPQAPPLRRSKRRRASTPSVEPTARCKRQKQGPRITAAELAASAAANPTGRAPRRFFREIDVHTGNVQPKFAATAVFVLGDTAWVELDMASICEKYGAMSTPDIIYEMNCTLKQKQYGFVVQQAPRSAIPAEPGVFSARVSANAGPRKPLHLSFRDNKVRVYSRTYSKVSYVDYDGPMPTRVTQVFVVPSVDQDGDEFLG